MCTVGLLLSHKLQMTVITKTDWDRRELKRSIVWSVIVSYWLWPYLCSRVASCLLPTVRQKFVERTRHQTPPVPRPIPVTSHTHDDDGDGGNRSCATFWAKALNKTHASVASQPGLGVGCLFIPPSRVYYSFPAAPASPIFYSFAFFSSPENNQGDFVVVVG